MPTKSRMEPLNQLTVGRGKEGDIWVVGQFETGDYHGVQCLASPLRSCWLRL